MKNNLLKAWILFCIILALGGCNKETPNPSQSGAEYNPLERLRSFRKQLEAVKTHPEAKSDEILTLTDALWGVQNRRGASCPAG